MSTTDEPSTTTPHSAAEEAPGGPATNAPEADAPQQSATAKKASPSAGFGLVFQAPDLSNAPTRKPRPRRESSSQRDDDATKDPNEAPEDHQAPNEPSPSPRPSPQAGDSDETSDSGQDSEGESGGAEGSSKNRRRKRGGKGRRGRGQDADSGQGESSSSASVGGPDSSSSSGGSNEQGETDGSQADASAGKSSSGGKSGGGKSGGGTSGGGKSGGAKSGARKSNGSDGTEKEGGNPPGASSQDAPDRADDDGEEDGDGSSKRRRRRRRGDSPERTARDEVTGVRGSTRLEAKRQRRREGREVGRRRTVISEAEFLARRESVDRVMVVRGLADRTQIGVLEDGVLVEHYVSQQTQSTTVGNVYLGRVQNVLPSMEAAFVDIGKGRNAVLYAGEVNWDAAGLEVNQAKRIENALTSGESVLVQVTKDPIGHKGARLTSQVSLPGRFLVYVPGNSMTGISRKLPDTERARLKKILKEVVPAEAGVIVRTAAEGASEADLRADVERLTAMWEDIQAKAKTKSKSANGPVLLHGEPEMTVRVIRDVFNEDFNKLIVSGDQAWTEISDYIDHVAPDLRDRVEKWTSPQDVFTEHRITEALAKAMDRKVWLPSGGSLVIDRTEAMTVVDVNTGKFVGSGGNLEETVTKNNIEAAEEIVRQLRVRDIGGIIVIDFIDMVLESNRDLVVRRLLECLGRDRTKHQVAEVTSLGLVQMTRKRVGSGLIEVFSESCAHCNGRGLLVHSEPVEKPMHEPANTTSRGRGSRKGRGSGSEGGQGHSNGASGHGSSGSGSSSNDAHTSAKTPSGPTPAQIAAAAHAAALQAGSSDDTAKATAAAVVDVHAEASGPMTATTVTRSEGVDNTSNPPATSDEPSSQPPKPSTANDGDSSSRSGAGAEPVTEAAERPLEMEVPEAPARPRRKRGRVVAPAGPPTAGGGEDS
ncbi:MAG: Rne/Rng family ribonuclease [Ornithinimicrobium sp.]